MSPKQGRLVLLLVFGISGFLGIPPLSAKGDSAQDRYGDPLPEGAIARFGEARFCFPDPVDCLAYSPDGKTLVVGSSSRATTVPQLWDTSTGKVIRRFEGHGEYFSNLSFSPDGKYLVGANSSIALCVWDAGTGRKISTLFRANSEPINTFAFSSDGKTLALVGGDEGNHITIMDVPTNKPLRTIITSKGVYRIAISADGKLLVTAGGDYKPQPIELWDVRTGKLRQRLSENPQSVETLAFSPDGTTILWTKYYTVHLWDVRVGREVRQISNAGGKAAFSPDGKLLATGGSCDRCPLRLWEASTGKELRRWNHVRDVYKVVFAPDGNSLAWASYDRRVQICAVPSGDSVPCFEGHERGVTTVGFSPDGRLLASGSRDRTVRIWEVSGGKRLRTLTAHLDSVTRVAFATDGRTLASGDEQGIVRVWDATTGRSLRLFTCPGEPIDSLSFLPSGRALFASNKRGEARFWDVVARKGHPDLPNNLKHFEPQFFASSGTFMAISPVGNVLAAGGQRTFADESVHLWGLPSGKYLVEMEPSGPNKKERGMTSFGGDAFEGMAFSPDGRTLAVCVSHSGSFNAYMYSNTPQISLWEVATGKEFLRVKPKYTHGNALTLSPDGKLLALEGDGGTILVYDLRTGKELPALRGNVNWVSTLAFSPDGKLLASGNNDGTILLWDTSRILKESAVPQKKLTQQELQALWEDLAGDDAAKANRSGWELVNGGRNAVDYLRNQLRPAVEVDAARVIQLLDDLDSKAFAVRDRARKELEELAELAESALRRVLEGGPSLEVRRRVERLLDQLDTRFSSRRLRILRAVAVAERLNSPEARRLLKDWSEGASGAWLTQQAKTALARLECASASRR